MKISRLCLAILLILILALIVFEVSNKGSGIGEGDDGRVGPESVRTSVRSTSENRREKTISRRKLVDADRFRAHSINIDEGESVFLKGRSLESDISEIINLSAEVVVMEDGTEVIRLLRKVVHSSEVASQENGVGNLFQEGEEELIVGEEDQQLRFRKLSQTIGTDIMTMETLLLEPGKAFEAVVVPGENQLHIEGVAERGRDGKLRMRFGRLYEVAEGE